MPRPTPEAFARRFPELAASLPDDDRRTLLDALALHRLEAGETLIAQGTRADALYFVWSGVLDVYLDTAEGERAVAEVGEGALLGEISLLSPGAATATVRTDEGCTALVLTHTRFARLCDEAPALAAALTQALARAVSARLRAADAYLHKLLDAQAPARPAAKPAGAKLVGAKPVGAKPVGAKPVLPPEQVVAAHARLFRPAS